MAAGCLLRLSLLGARSMWVDEALTVITARASLAEIPSLVRLLQGTPPLYFFMIHFWLPVCRDPLIAIRTFSAFCGMAALGVFFLFCRRVAPRHLPLAMFIASFSSFWISISQDGKLYDLYLLIAIAQFYALYALMDEYSLRWLAAYTIIGVTGMYTHTFFVFLLASCFFQFALVSRRLPSRVAWWTASHSAIAALYAPWIPSLLAQMRIPYAQFPDSFSLGRVFHGFGLFFFNVFFVDMLYPNWIRIIGAAASAVMVLGTVYRLRFAKDESTRRLPIFCAVHIVTILAMVKLAEMFIGRPITQPRYLVALSPLMYVSIAQFVGEIRLPAPFGHIHWGKILIGILVSAGTVGYFACGVLIDPRLAKMSAAISGLADKDTPVIHLYNYYYPPLRYYYLPERRHLLLCPDPFWVNWNALPGYRTTISSEELSTLGEVVFVDPQRKFSERGIGVSTGRVLSNFLCP
jgi:uncharacterized membrane protein